MEDNVSTQGEPNKPKFVPERPKTGTYDNIADNKETAKRKKESAAATAAAKLAKEKPIDWKKHMVQEDNVWKNIDQKEV